MHIVNNLEETTDQAKIIHSSESLHSVVQGPGGKALLAGKRFHSFIKIFAWVFSPPTWWRSYLSCTIAWGGRRRLRNIAWTKMLLSLTKTSAVRLLWVSSKAILMWQMMPLILGRVLHWFLLTKMVVWYSPWWLTSSYQCVGKRLERDFCSCPAAEFSGHGNLIKPECCFLGISVSDETCSSLVDLEVNRFKVPAGQYSQLPPGLPSPPSCPHPRQPDAESGHALVLPTLPYRFTCLPSLQRGRSKGKAAHTPHTPPPRPPFCIPEDQW